MHEQIAHEQPNQQNSLIGNQLPQKANTHSTHRQNTKLPVLHYPDQLPKFGGPGPLALVPSGIKLSAGKQAE
jgi:hypothetical protein